jgi:D-beta-D-heptose 7-phosphate kinase/D-beta-D-heptose 1-phosphate adenosyltransferase
MDKIIFTNGCFDILHVGHIKMLQYCKSLGSKLIVAIDSDKRVSFLKGEKRPINKENDRKFLLESIKSVDHVVIFNSEEELRNLVKHYNPDIMVVGSDYKNKNVIGSEFCKKLLFFERIDEYSTTKTIQDISNR